MLGRDGESEILDGLLRQIHDRGGALVVRGDPGIGKSALLALARAHAVNLGLAILETSGAQIETVLPFAGLYQLLRPVLHHASELPEPQRKALLAAFGMAEAGDSNRFLIALAALEILAHVATATPLLLLLDDVQWLDSSSAEVLTFVARRLQSEPIILLAAAREGVNGTFLDAGLAELRLEGLDPASSTALLAECAPNLEPALAGRVLREAQGNPLALIELPAALRDQSRDRGMATLSSLPLTARLEKAFLDRMSVLPEATRTVLLVAACDDGDDLSEIVAATSTLMSSPDEAEEALSPALRSTLVHTDGRSLQFRHPLVRSAIHQAASPRRRRAAHMALAAVLADAPDRRIWHRAASIVGTSDEVALELEAMALRAEQRGDPMRAAAGLERAGQLATQPERRGELLLKAAVHVGNLGHHGDVVRLLRAIEPLELAPRERVQFQWLREVYDTPRSGWSGAARLREFADIADHAHQEGDDQLALSFLDQISLRSFYSNPDEETRRVIVAAAERLAVPEDSPTLLQILGLVAPIERGALVLERLARLRPADSSDPAAMCSLGNAASAVGAMDTAAGYYVAAVAGYRARGWLGELARALVAQSYAAIHLGNWPLAMMAADEGERLAAETGQGNFRVTAQACQAIVAALRGEEAMAESLANAVERVLIPLGANPLLALVQLARGHAALGTGRYSEAFDHLARILDPRDSAYHAVVRYQTVAGLAEAALYGGRADEAQAFLEEMQTIAAISRWPVLHVGLLYAQAVLSDEETREARFDDALAADLSVWPFHRARVLLAYGSWLRRRRRVSESRAPLRAARVLFDGLGAARWSERARQELRASGESSRKRAPEARDQLSPQELHIAQMAAQGLSNREIGQRLFLSHRTVGFHLSRVFPKLGITSRSELRSVSL